MTRDISFRDDRFRTDDRRYGDGILEKDLARKYQYSPKKYLHGYHPDLYLPE